MGIFNTLRVKMGSVLIALIGLSILAFLFTDLLGPNSMLLGGGGQNNVGEIAGETISMERYQQKIEEFKFNFQSNQGRTPSEAEMTSIRQQAWDFMIIEVAFEEQYEELGIEVTDEELIDMVQGDNISPTIKQAFTDPETGEFNKERVIQTIQNIAQAPAEQQTQWYSFEASLLPARERTKYDELMVSTTYVTQAEAQQAYEKENETLEVEYLYIPFTSVADSLKQPTDEQLKAYFNDHKETYETDASRTLNYIAFDISPSAEDSLYLRKEVEEIKEDFTNAEEDSAFAASNSDRSNVLKTYGITELPDILASNTNILNKGDVIGPYIENGAYVLYKLSDIYDAEEQSVKASHILIKTGDDIDEAAAKKKANEALAKAKAGEDFAELAKEYSEGPTAIKGGDLGWFKEGQMVDEFNQAVFEKSGTGLINRLIKTQFGFHIIKVTEEKTAKTYDISVIEREIIPSEGSRDQAFRKADYFAASNANLKEFSAAAEEEGYNVRVSGKLNKNQRNIGTLSSAREIVRWSFTDASLNEVSEVFETPEAYVVAVLAKKTEDSEADFQSSKLAVTREVKKELAADIIKEKLAGKAGALSEIAAAYGSEAELGSKSDLKITESSLPTVGQAPEVIGTAFGLTENQVSKPLVADRGVVLIKVLNRTPAPEIADYASYKDQIAQNRENTISFSIKNAIEDKADIVDERYKFF